MGYPAPAELGAGGAPRAPGAPFGGRLAQGVHRAGGADSAQRVRGGAAVLPVGEDRPPVPGVQRDLERLDGLGAAERSERLDGRQVELREPPAIHLPDEVAVERRGPLVPHLQHLAEQRRRAPCPLAVVSAFSRMTAASFVPFSISPCTASRCTSGSESDEERHQFLEALGAAELAQQEGRGAADFPALRVEQRPDGLGAARAEADQEIPQALPGARVLLGREHLGERRDDRRADRVADAP